jgi:fructose-1,6-bisphosphatase I
MLLEQIAFAAKMIGREVNKAGIANIVGATKSSNSSGETQQKLDVFSDTKMIEALDHLGLLGGMASEEDEGVIPIPEDHPSGKYLAVFDPLDGSSNIDVNTSIGTIFGIYRKKTDGKVTAEDFLQPARDLVAAGYIIYGSSTMLVYSTGSGVNGFTLDPGVGEFILSHPDMTIPERGKYYSANDANFEQWHPAIRRYIRDLRTLKDYRYSSRYTGSFVADFHRNLLKGGIFIYPGDEKNPKGKLRLLYEAGPMGFLAEQAGGRAVDGTGNVLDIVPKTIHHRVPLIVGSKWEVDLFMDYMKENDSVDY